MWPGRSRWAPAWWWSGWSWCSSRWASCSPCSPGSTPAPGRARSRVGTEIATPAGPVLDGTVRLLLSRIAADPGAPVQLGITAPGGYGKTLALHALERQYRAAGVPLSTVDAPGDGVLLVDDAHRLGEEQLRHLIRLAREPRTRLAVA